MTNVLVPSDTPCVIPDFDPEDDVLVIALPEDAGADLDHVLDIARDEAGEACDVTLTLERTGARFLIRLPGVAALDPSAIAVLSLEDAERLRPQGSPAARRRLPRHDPKLLTGHGVHCAGPWTGGSGAGNGRPRKMAFVHRHDWAADGPPSERFFDLSNPASELSVTLDEGSGGPVYTIQFTEEAGNGQTRDSYRSILLAQTAPGSPVLRQAELTRWFATRLGTADFRIIAWIYLGNAGSYRDSATGKLHRFGAINDSPRLAIHGPIAGSAAIRR